MTVFVVAAVGWSIVAAVCVLAWYRVDALERRLLAELAAMGLPAPAERDRPRGPASLPPARLVARSQQLVRARQTHPGKRGRR